MNNLRNVFLSFVFLSILLVPTMISASNFNWARNLDAPTTSQTIWLNISTGTVKTFTGAKIFYIYNTTSLSPVYNDPKLAFCGYANFSAQDGWNVVGTVTFNGNATIATGAGNKLNKMFPCYQHKKVIVLRRQVGFANGRYTYCSNATPATGLTPSFDFQERTDLGSKVGYYNGAAYVNTNWAPVINKDWVMIDNGKTARTFSFYVDGTRYVNSGAYDSRFVGTDCRGIYLDGIGGVDKVDSLYMYNVPTTMPTITKTYNSTFKYWKVVINNSAGLNLTSFTANITGINLTGALLITDVLRNFTVPVEKVPYIPKIYSNETILLNFSNYTYLLLGSISLTKSTTTHISSVFNIYNLYNGSYYCKNTIDNNSYGSERLFSNYDDSLNNVYVLSNAVNLTAGSHVIGVSCKKQSSSTPDILITQIDTSLIAHNYTRFYNITNTINNVGYKNIANLTYQSISSSFYHSLFVEGISDNNLKNIQLIININGSNVSKYVLNSSFSQRISINNLRLGIPSNRTNIIRLYAKTNETSSTINLRLHVTEIVSSIAGDVSAKITNNRRLNSTNYVNISNINITLDSSRNLYVSGYASVKANSSGDIALRLKVGTKYFYYYKTLNTGNTEVIEFQHLFDNETVGNKVIFLQALSSNHNMTLLNSSVSAFNSELLTFTETSFSVYAYDSYKGTMLHNFSVWLGSNKYTTTFSRIKVYTANAFENFTVGSTQNGGYFNESVLNFNTALDLNQSLSQTYITLYFKHIQSNETIPGGVVITDTTYSKTYPAVSGTTFSFPAGVISLTFNKTGYAVSTISYTFVAFDNYSIFVYFKPIINATLYDEKTLAIFDISKPTLITMQVICNNGSVYQQPINNYTYLFALNCTYRKIKFLVDYPQDSYYRTYPSLSPSLLSVSESNLTIWLIELNSTTAIFNTFQIYDLFNDYEDEIILFYKNIGSVEYLITGDAIDVEGKIGAYFIQNAEYTLKVLSSNRPERDMGNYYADVGGQCVISLFDLSLASEASSFNSQVSAYSYLANESGNIIIRSRINDTGDNIQSSHFEVRGNSSSGFIYCSMFSLSANVDYSCDVPDSASNNYYVTLLVNLTNSTTQKLFEKFLKGSELIAFPVTFTNSNTQPWLMYMLMLIFAFTLTITTGTLGALLIVIFAIFLRAIGWINLSRLSTASTAVNLAIAGAMVSIMLLITIAYLLRERRV